MTADGFCPESECYGIGFLSESTTSQTGPGATPQMGTNVREVGLCILLMDASASMREQAFPDHPATKDRLIAGSAAAGIFELRQLSKLEDAYLVVVMFDTAQRVTLCCSFAELFAKFPTAGDFSEFLMKSFTYGSTDINSALRFGKDIYDSFMKRGDLTAYGGPKGVKPIMHTIMTKDLDSRVVPNVRVLIYTDGEDTATGGISGNPFAMEGTDVLLGAYFGRGEEEGCLQLKKSLSKCPVHQVDQFFLINDAKRIQTLRKLFRMASGASGFCPTCLVQN